MPYFRPTPCEEIHLGNRLMMLRNFPARFSASELLGLNKWAIVGFSEAHRLGQSLDNSFPDGAFSAVALDFTGLAIRLNGLLRWRPE